MVCLSVSFLHVTSSGCNAHKRSAIRLFRNIALLHFCAFALSDVLRRLSSTGFGVHDHGLPERRQDQQGHHRSDGRRALVGLPGVRTGRPPNDVHNAMGPVGRQGHWYRDHDPGNGRVAGRRVRAHRAPELGIGRRPNEFHTRNERDDVQRHSQTADRRRSR